MILYLVFLVELELEHHWCIYFRHLNWLQNYLEKSLLRFLDRHKQHHLMQEI